MGFGTYRSTIAAMAAQRVNALITTISISFLDDVNVVVDMAVSEKFGVAGISVGAQYGRVCRGAVRRKIPEQKSARYHHQRRAHPGQCGAGFRRAQRTGAAPEAAE